MYWSFLNLRCRAPSDLELLQMKRRTHWNKLSTYTLYELLFELRKVYILYSMILGHSRLFLCLLPYNFFVYRKCGLSGF